MVASIPGFQTTHGSIYAYDENGLTIRLKMSSGRGQGEFHTPSVCVFVSQQAMNWIAKHYFSSHDEVRLFIGYKTLENPNLTPLLSFKDLPRDIEPVLVIQERASGKVIGHGTAILEPKIGSYPVEKAYDKENGTSTTHVGNKVARIFETAAEVKQAIANVPASTISAVRSPTKVSDVGIKQLAN